MTAEPLTAAEQERVARFDAAPPAEESFENVERVMQAIWEAADGYMSGVPWERARLNAFREAKVFRQAAAALTAMRPAPDTAKADRTFAAARFLHDQEGHRSDLPCIACPTRSTLTAALDHLDAHPRDARTVRRIFHDAVCVSGCGPESDHADRTQAGRAAALRKFRAVDAAS